ncbi:MAG: hypothetical protein L6256_11375, partial [Propionicimonas sp.]|uniref:hypothetical protein n=2 Tax=Propionicimonas sp. TaxID=1955623 RepID=UPI0025F05577
ASRWRQHQAGGAEMKQTPTAVRAPSQQFGSSRSVSWRRTIVLAGAGGLAFWMVNFAISLTPIAAEYRAGLAIAYFPMLLQALAGGLVIGLCVAYPLQRFFDLIPPKSTMLKAVVLSGAALLAVTVLIEVPAKFIAIPDSGVRYFLIGLLFNALRFLALGVVIGIVHGRQRAGAEG